MAATFCWQEGRGIITSRIWKTGSGNGCKVRSSVQTNRQERGPTPDSLTTIFPPSRSFSGRQDISLNPQGVRKRPRPRAPPQRTRSSVPTSRGCAWLSGAAVWCDCRPRALCHSPFIHLPPFTSAAHPSRSANPMHYTNLQPRSPPLSSHIAQQS